MPPDTTLKHVLASRETMLLVALASHEDVAEVVTCDPLHLLVDLGEIASFVVADDV